MQCAQHSILFFQSGSKIKVPEYASGTLILDVSGLCQRPDHWDSKRRNTGYNAMIFDRCLSIGWSLGAILRLRRKRRGRKTALLFELGAVHSVPRESQRGLSPLCDILGPLGPWESRPRLKPHRLRLGRVRGLPPPARSRPGSRPPARAGC